MQSGNRSLTWPATAFDWREADGGPRPGLEVNLYHVQVTISATERSTHPVFHVRLYCRVRPHHLHQQIVRSALADRGRSIPTVMSSSVMFSTLSYYECHVSGTSAPTPLMQTDQVVVLPQGTERDTSPTGAGDIFGVYIRRILCPRNRG